MTQSIIRLLEESFGDRLQQNVRMSNYTTSRVGGLALGLLPINTLDEMREAATKLWSHQVPFKVLGSGANVLISDKGYPGIILLNRCHNIKIYSQEESPYVYCESERTSAPWRANQLCAGYWIGMGEQYPRNRWRRRLATLARMVRMYLKP